MTAPEMHVWFRQYAQQMGMQNTRAILPEQIDVLINTSTQDIVSEVINRSVGTTNDRVISDNAKLASINALKTLYKVKEVSVEDTRTIKELGYTPYKMYSTAIGEQALYYVDFAIIYNLGEDKTSRLFPIRVIDESKLADCLNDWILAPRMRTPVMVIYKDDRVNAKNEDSVFDIYLGDNDNDSLKDIAASATIASIRCSYIKKPNTVKYVSDITGDASENFNSDLPEQLQIPMLKHAVDLYRISVSGSLYANQQNAQANQQEMVRNNARPDNDGYQS